MQYPFGGKTSHLFRYRLRLSRHQVRYLKTAVEGQKAKDQTMQKSAPVTPDQSHLAPIIHEIERYIRRKRIGASVFGMAAMNDPNFVRDLRKGRDPSSRVVERVRYFMRGEA